MIRKRDSSADRPRKEFRVIAAIIAAVTLPTILAYILVATDMRADLSELKPVQDPGDQAPAAIGWADLETENGLPVSLDQVSWHSRVRMLGYMMDGNTTVPNGAPVDVFVLMPEAGHWLHPAHRIPNQMVEIRLGRPVPFAFRRLVGVSGMLGRTERPERDKALYVMEDAVVEPAEERDITRWFHP